MSAKTIHAPPAIADTLRRWRKRCRLSQSQAALRLQISVDTLQNWEQKRRAPRGFTLLALRERLKRIT